MAMETETLISEMSDFNNQCCCCSIRGCVKDICTEYYDTGECEVYSEMIRTTFNINIEHDLKKKQPHDFKQYICEHCIVQLRNAYSFKLKLMKNYEDFLWRLTKLQKTGFKNQEIQTKIHSIKSEFNNYGNEINQPKVCENQSNYISIKNESVVEGIIQSVNQQIGIIDTIIVPKDMKRKKTVKLSSVKSENKFKKPNLETKVNRRKNKISDDGLKKTKRTKNLGAAGTIMRENSLQLLANSSLWVFQWKGHNEYICFLCKESYTDIEILKTHTKTHTLREIEKKITNSSNGRVKVEISDLFCKICNTKLDSLPELEKHLKIHGIVVNEHLLVPFKLNNEFKCQICLKMFNNFRLLKSHLLKHYQSFVCEVCGSEFYKKEYLSNHITNKHSNKKADQSKNKFKCRICHENFSTYPRKLEHMVEKHGLKKPEFPCKLCTKVYIIKGLLNRHMKLTHFAELKEKNYECDVCFKRFFRSHDVIRHKETHSEGLNYSCVICNHSFKLKTSLGRHVRRMHR